MFSSRSLNILLLLPLLLFHLINAADINFQRMNEGSELKTFRAESPKSSSVCPHDCGYYGECDEDKQQCVCSNGVFDSDCSVLGLRLMSNALSGIVIPARTAGLFYLDIFDESGELTIDFGYSPKPVNILIKFASYNNYQIPNAEYKDAEYKLPESSNRFTLKFSKQDIKDHMNQRLLLVIENRQIREVAITILPTFAKSSMMNSVLIGIGMVVMFCFMLFCFCSMRRKRRLRRAQAAWRQRQSLRRQQVENGPPEAASVANPEENIVFLTQEELDKFFPETKFADLKSQFPQQACSICLEDFKAGAVCRQLYCVHIFHSQCIQLWLKKHQDCPNCKKEMTRETIRKNLIASKKGSKKQKAKKYVVEEEKANIEESPEINNA